MNGRKIPRYGRMILASGVALAAIVAVLFYQEFRSLKDSLNGSPPEMHGAIVRESYLWIGGWSIFALGICLAIGYFVYRREGMRIRALQMEAEKLRDADFGERLPEDPSDALGQLAAVFNDMRDRLRTTTISRDYVDRILSGMNEAIVITSSDGKIKRINRATTILLGFDEKELVGTSIDYIVDTRKAGSLIDDSVSGVPKEVMFESKFGESIPVSYTCSIIDGEGGDSHDRVYAAQNITERRRAEQRIRYLARIDALTKIPNRMQFQHLLQRAIARGAPGPSAALPLLHRHRSFQGHQRHLWSPGRRRDARNCCRASCNSPARRLGHWPSCRR